MEAEATGVLKSKTFRVEDYLYSTFCKLFCVIAVTVT